jgi:hypothetical protein
MLSIKQIGQITVESLQEGSIIKGKPNILIQKGVV